MNILFLANHINPGGISSYLYTLGVGLRRNGHNVYLASSGGEWVRRFQSAGIEHLKVPLNTKKEISPKIIFSFFKINKNIKRLNIELVHSNSRTTQVLGCLLNRYSGVRHIFTCHGFFKPKLSRKFFPCWGNAVIAISQQVKEHLILDFKLDEKRISLINNGIDAGAFGDFSARDKARNGLGIKDAFLVGIIARLSDVKGHTYLIQAMQEVIKVYPATKLLIVGEGKIKGMLLRLACDLGVNENVIFLPEAENTQEILAAMDIFVMPSLQEGLGLALMEAMAQGLAVVGSAVGGIKTLIQHEVNGLLVQPANAIAISAAIIKLLNHSSLRQDLGKNARKFIIDNFSQSKMVDTTERAYKQCLKAA